jgi:hypothetical protein
VVEQHLHVRRPARLDAPLQAPPVPVRHQNVTGELLDLQGGLVRHPFGSPASHVQQELVTVLIDSSARRLAARRLLPSASKSWIKKNVKLSYDQATWWLTLDTRTAGSVV